MSDAEAARDAAIREAQQWKMEAQNANATIAEIYRLVGSQAGNWNGAAPVRAALSSAGGGEAVAWLCVSEDGSSVLATASQFVREDYARFGRTITPLYTAPTPQAQGERDGERLDALERAVNEMDALLLHNGKADCKGFPGLGLLNTGRTLRQAIDQFAGFEPPAIAAQQPKGAGQ